MRRVSVLLFLLYLAIGLSWPGARHFSADGDAKSIQVLALRYDDGLRIDYRWPGAAIDPSRMTLPLGSSYVGTYKGEIRFAWPVPFAIASRMFLALFGERGLFVLPALAGALVAFFTGMVSERLRRGSGPLGAAVVGLATPVFFYSTMFWEHTPALALAMGGVVLLLGQDKRGLVLAGVLFAAAAGAFRSDFYIFAAAMIAGAFFAWRGNRRFVNVALVLAGATVGSLPWFLLNHEVSGHIVPLNAVKNRAAVSAAYFLAANVATIPQYLVGTSVLVHLRWSMSVVAIVAVLVIRVLRVRAGWLATLVLCGWCAVTAATLWSLAEKETIVLHGWLLSGPILLVAFLVPMPNGEDVLVTRVIKLALIFHLLIDYVLIMASYPEGFASDGNLEWGPRYYIGVFPLLAALTAQRWPSLTAGRAMRSSMTVSFLLSVAVEITGLARARHLTLESDRGARMIENSAAVPMISDSWTKPASNHAAIFVRPCFNLGLEGKDFFPTLIERISKGGYRRVQIVSYIPWRYHPFAVSALPPGIKLAVERVDETDNLQATTLSISASP